MILGVITTQRPDPVCPTDYAIEEWKLAGLHAPSYFRLYLTTLLRRDVRVIGRLADRDWTAVKARAAIGFVGDDE